MFLAVLFVDLSFFHKRRFGCALIAEDRVIEKGVTILLPEPKAFGVQQVAGVPEISTLHVPDIYK